MPQITATTGPKVSFKACMFRPNSNRPLYYNQQGQLVKVLFLDQDRIGTVRATPYGDGLWSAKLTSGITVLAQVDNLPWKHLINTLVAEYIESTEATEAQA